MPSIGQSLLTALQAEQRVLEDRLHDHVESPRQALAAGRALLAFAGREAEVFSGVSSLLDPAVHADMEAEHQQIAEDLELLDWLLRMTPDSPDVAVLTISLVRRMRQHIDRDGRLLSRAFILSTHQPG
jgi:hypothetical protein